MSSHVSHVTRTTLFTEPAAPPSLFPLAGPPGWLSVADAGRRGADQVGDVGMRGRIVGAQVAGREPAVFVGGGLLPLVQAIEAHLGRGRPGPRRRSGPGRCGDRPRRTRSCSARWAHRAARGRPRCGSPRTVRGRPRRAGTRPRPLGRAADGEPEGVIGMVRIPAVQQQHAPFHVDRQHPGGLPADGRSAPGASFGSGTVTATPRSWRSGSPGCPGRRPPSGPVSAC